MTRGIRSWGPGTRFLSEPSLRDGTNRRGRIRLAPNERLSVATDAKGIRASRCCPRQSLKRDQSETSKRALLGVKMNMRKSKNTCLKILALMAVIVGRPVVALADTTSTKTD